MRRRFSYGRGRGAEKPLARSFFNRPVLEVAHDCIGMVLISDVDGARVEGRIVETEAYRGPEDRAAHSYGHRRTPRTEVMFGPAGFSYVFILYGMHHHLNFVTGDVEQPEAVLVRAVEPLRGQDVMAKRRQLAPDSKQLCNGPGKLCQAFGITREHYGSDLTQGVIRLRYGPPTAVETSPRTGIDYAGEWAKVPWRFYEPGNPHVSPIRNKK